MFIQKIIRSSIDIFVIFFIFVFSVVISTIGLTVKANQYKSEKNNIVKITVYKKPIPILSTTKGIIQKVHVRPGQEVRRGDILVEIDNPVLKGKITALQNYPDNLSARTEAEVAQIELNYLNVPSPVDGVVGEIQVTDGVPVQELTPLLSLYSNEDVTLTTSLYTDQYLQLKQQSLVKAYNERLNQTFLLTPSLVRPDIEIPVDQTDQKKIGLYFNLLHKEEAASLLQNEDMELSTSVDAAENPNRPIDYVINFWNRILFASE